MDTDDDTDEPNYKLFNIVEKFDKFRPVTCDDANNADKARQLLSYLFSVTNIDILEQHDNPEFEAHERHTL